MSVTLLDRSGETINLDIATAQTECCELSWRPSACSSENEGGIIAECCFGWRTRVMVGLQLASGSR